MESLGVLIAKVVNSNGRIKRNAIIRQLERLIGYRQYSPIALLRPVAQAVTRTAQPDFADAERPRRRRINSRGVSGSNDWTKSPVLKELFVPSFAQDECPDCLDKCQIVWNTWPMNLEQKLDRAVTVLLKPVEKVKPGSTSRRKVTYEELLSDKMLMIRAIRTGVPYSLFALIQDVSPFTEGDWAEFLDLSTKSLQRYRQQSKPFRPLQSEKIIEMAEVTKIGVEVFGEIEKFKLWLNTPNFALGGTTPMELLKDSYGKELVLAELTRINYGIFV